MTKTARMVARYQQGDVAIAFGIAKGFRLGLTPDERADLARGHEVLTGRGAFYAQIGKDPSVLVAKAHSTFRRHWLPTPTIPEASKCAPTGI